VHDSRTGTDSRRLARLQELFDAASRLDAENRAAYLDRECAGQTALRLQVVSLLRSLEGESLIEPALRNAAAGPDLAEGHRIGPYRVIRVLGQGGMGVVYLASRADETFDKQVAIKLLSTGWLREDMKRRFQLERQILARLEHPNIARLLDGGTVDGAAYVVMEYVDGPPIDKHCRDGNLSIQERLILFRQVCDSVAYAHRNLIVHRDIKPGNVLMSGDVPKLLDFGIARLIGNEEMPGGPLTHTGDRLMTPDYASPEQVRGEPITTASDVYSLGVLLYELLTGERPFRSSGLTPEEMERAICTEEPPRPSSLMPRRGLEGDLDNIVLMTMRKEPSRRYASADQISEDVRRYLDGFPVIARKDTLTYRADKFIRRHKWGVTAGAAAIIMIVAFAAGMGLLARRVAAERDTAQTERSRAEQVSKLLLDTFQVADPARGDGNKVTAREILDRASNQVGKQTLDSATRARVLDTLGTVYKNLGVYDRSREELEQARDLRVKLYGSKSPEYAASLESLAMLADESGDWNRAEKLLRQAIGLRTGHSDQDKERALALADLATEIRRLGRLPEAEQVARRESILPGVSPERNHWRWLKPR
jgi:serine/threonine-protein kinase